MPRLSNAELALERTIKCPVHRVTGRHCHHGLAECDACPAACVHWMHELTQMKQKTKETFMTTTTQPATMTEIVVHFADGTEARFPAGVLKSGADEKGFIDIFAKALHTFSVQNLKYKDSWKTDDLDARAVFCQIVSKHKRLKSLIWDEWEQVADERHRGRLIETVIDNAMYLAMLARRLDIDYGPVSAELLRALRDRS